MKKFISPYRDKNKVNPILKKHENKPGVYLIRSNKTNEIYYVGYSETNVYKTMFRHFQSWDDPNQFRAIYRHYNIYEVRIIQTTPKRAAAIEKALIIKLKPRDNENKLKNYEFSEAEKRHIKTVISENIIPEYLKTINDVPF